MLNEVRVSDRAFPRLRHQIRHFLPLNYQQWCRQRCSDME
jgi:hypothetical protein